MTGRQYKPRAVADDDPRFFHGPPCIQCKNTLRYVCGGHCRSCALIGMKAYRRRRRAADLAAQARATAGFDAEVATVIVNPDSLLKLPWER